jgi:hypothetical protein
VKIICSEMDKQVMQFGLAYPENTVVLVTSLMEEDNGDGKGEC